MAALVESLVEKTLAEFMVITKKPEDLLSTQEHIANKFKKCTKQLYDLNLSCTKLENQQVLTELITDNFDEEQVWQELELYNEPDILNLLSVVSQLVAAKKSIHFKQKKKKKINNVVGEEELQSDIEFNENEKEKSEESDIDQAISEYKSQLDGDDDSESEIDFDFDAVDVGDDEGGESDEDILKQGEKDRPNKLSNLKAKSSQKGKSSVVDDEFFKLSQLEQFLTEQESRDERNRKKDDGENVDEDEEDDIDLFQNITDDEGEDARNAMYSKFFDDVDGTGMEEEKRVKFKEPNEEIDEGEMGSSGEHGEEDDEDGDDEDGDDEEIDEESGEEDGNEEQDFEELTEKKVKDNLLKADESDGEDISDVLGGKKEDTKSTFELRQEKLKKQINKLEIGNLASKPWQMSGEIGSTLRPENSLLEEHLQFDHTTKMTPVITEETSKNIEDIIIQRIRDKAWDDVERKEKPKEDTMEYKKRIVLDQEKSKQSLAQIYEDEYLKQQQKDKEEETDEKNPERDTIKNMMQSLFIKLDALSNFHYTPKQVQPELRVISNMPAINMEEVAPVSKSDAQLIAPEEIKAKAKGELKGATEKTDTDRKRERRKKKAEKRTKQKEKLKREKLVDKMNPGLGNKYSKESALRDLEKSSKISKNDVTVLKSDKKKSSLTSSTSFFKQLQEEVKTQVLSRKAEKMKKKNQAVENNSAKKLKL